MFGVNGVNGGQVLKYKKMFIIISTWPDH